jgi:hypothetical protein
LGYWLRTHKDRRSGDLVLRNTRDVHTKSAKWFVAGFGVAADERFTAVLNSITKAAAVQCGVPHPPTDREEVTADRARKAAYMRRYRSAMKMEAAGG